MPGSVCKDDQWGQVMGNSKDSQARSIRSRIRRYKAQKSSLENEVRILNGKIERLKRAYRQIHEAKKGYDKEKKALQKIYEERFSWQGSNYDTFVNKSNTCKRANDSFLRDIDRVQDEVNRTLTSYENQVIEKTGMIGKIAGWINSAWTELENLFN